MRDTQSLIKRQTYGKISGLFPEGAVREFASALGGGSAAHLTFGSHADKQALYYTTYASGRVRRIAYTGQGGPLLPPVYYIDAATTCLQAASRHSSVAGWRKGLP
jgi:hypothetical protein